MNDFPFLTNAQVEELQQFGMIELTEDMMESWEAWIAETESEAEGG